MCAAPEQRFDLGVGKGETFEEAALREDVFFSGAPDDGRGLGPAAFAIPPPAIWRVWD